MAQTNSKLPRELSLTFIQKLTVGGVTYPSGAVAYKMILKERMDAVREQIRDEILDEILQAKFQDREMRNLLLSTPTTDLPSPALVRIQEKLHQEAVGS